jgi:hypothetical protein
VTNFTPNTFYFSCKIQKVEKNKEGMMMMMMMIMMMMMSNKLNPEVTSETEEASQ